MVDGYTGSEIALPVFALEHLSDDACVIEIVEHKVESGHQSVAVSAEFGIRWEGTVRYIGEFGEERTGRRMSTEKPFLNDKIML